MREIFFLLLRDFLPAIKTSKVQIFLACLFMPFAFANQLCSHLVVKVTGLIVDMAIGRAKSIGGEFAIDFS